MKTVRADKGGEFTSGEMGRFCKSRGIKGSLQHRTPSKNGVVKRKNKTVVEMARTMIAHRNLPLTLWVEAVVTAVHILNRSPTVAVPDMTPF